VKVRETENSIYNGLGTMEWYRYLRAMWMVGSELLDLYNDRISDLDRPLIMATLDLIRSVAKSENVSADSSQKAVDLDAEWEWVIDENEDKVSAGQWNMWMVFGMLVTEITGDGEPHSAAERVNLALTKRFREKPRSDGRPNIRRVDPAEEISDESPMAQLLSRVQRIVSGVPQLPGTVRDPAAARDQLFGLRAVSLLRRRGRRG
jgi:hypothetical protein